MSWIRIFHLIKKELIQIYRDKRILRFVLLAPVFQLILFGYAITSDVKHISTAVVDYDHTMESRALISKLSASSEYFTIRKHLESSDEIDKLIDKSEIQMALVIPKGFASDIGSQQNPKIQVIIDGVDSKTALIIGNYITALSNQFYNSYQSTRFSTSPFDLRLRSWYNPDLRSVNYLVPGVLSMILMIITMILTSLAIVREREIGTLEQLIVTPIKSSELMIGKILPFAMIGFIDIILVILTATLWFKVPIAGSLLLLFALTIIFITASLGLGLFVSTVSKTQQQAMMISFFIMQPSILLSGFMFPIDNMPVAIQYITYLIPLRYFLEIVRGIFLRGVGIELLWPQTICLAVLGGLLFAGSVKRFTKKIG
ncbi:MAG: ABC transporter permease [Armatimonadota bacterium]